MKNLLNILLLFIFTFSLFLFFTYLIEYLKNKSFNAWTSGIVKKIFLQDKIEIWEIHWTLPEIYFNENKEVQRSLIYNFKKNTNKEKIEEEYLQQNVNKKFYLHLEIDKKGKFINVKNFSNDKNRFLTYGFLSFISFFIWYFIK